MNFFSWAQVTALFSVVLIDLTLAVDNAVVMGTVAAGLEPQLRRKAILIGVGAAAFLRILLACFAIRMLEVVGLTLAGGLLLLWVSWKMMREIRRSDEKQSLEKTAAGSTVRHQKTLRHAVWQVLFADLSMSLDNTLAVAGAARNHFWIMVIGLSISVILMAVAANLLAAVVHRHRWISYVGLATVVYVAFSMIWEGLRSVIAAF